MVPGTAWLSITYVKFELCELGASEDDCLVQYIPIDVFTNSIRHISFKDPSAFFEEGKTYHFKMAYGEGRISLRKVRIKDPDAVLDEHSSLYNSIVYEIKDSDGLHYVLENMQCGELASPNDDGDYFDWRGIQVDGAGYCYRTDDHGQQSRISDLMTGYFEGGGFEFLCINGNEIVVNGILYTAEDAGETNFQSKFLKK